MEENEKKEEEIRLTDTPEEEKKKRIIFWTRVVLFVIFGLVVPFAFITWRFNLFQKVSSLAIGGYGILAITIGAIFIIIVLRYLAKALEVKNAYVAHLINATLYLIIPVTAAVLMINSMKNSTQLLVQVLGVCDVAFICAALVDPFPEFIADKKKQQKMKENEDLADYIINKIKKKDSKDE